MLSQKQQRSRELSKLMGEKLLQRWRMLADTCIDCAIPYMQ